MSAILEWSVPMTLTSPEGTLGLNQTDGEGRRFELIADECDSDQDMFAKKAKISGGDGEIFSHRSKGGYTAQIALRMLKDGAYAIGADLVAMWDLLLLHLDALENPTLTDLVSQCRLQWTPSGSGDDWMLDRVRTAARPKPSGVYPKHVVFALDTELPYAMRANQTTTSLADGVEQTIDNADSTARRFYPVYKVYGPATDFTIVNTAAVDVNGNPLQIVYDNGLPGPPPAIGIGDFVEISTFRETVVFNGDEDFGSIAGIKFPDSELRLPLVPGPNPITVTGADADLLWQPARA